MPHNLDTLNNDELIAAYGDLVRLFKIRGIIRTKNVVGDIGETLAITHYGKTPGLPRLVRAPANTTDIDALAGTDRYSIKCTTGNRTSAFHLDEKLSTDYSGRPAFEHAIVVMLADDYRVKRIQQFSWREFLVSKKWSKRQKAWFIPLTREVLCRGREIYVAP
jgi:hypothetical protein